MKKLVLVVLGALGALGIAVGGVACSGKAEAQAPAKPMAALATATIGIEGMTCASCAVTVRLVFTKLEGVSEAKVSYSDKRATVEYEPAKVTPAQLVGAVKGLGYEATLLTP